MKLTDKVIADILADMVIIVDTREQRNEHILKYFKDNNIKYEIKKLDTADYSFELPNYPELSLDRMFLVEKKNSLDEISGNFSKDRERFQREFERVGEASIHLLIEGATWKKLLKGSYRSKLNPKSFKASLLSWSIRYNCQVWFVGEDESPEILHSILHYELLEKLKDLRKKSVDIPKEG